MGDRGNIVLREQRADDIYLYSHWSGYRLPEKLREALEHGKDRWGDESYLNRIIIDQVFKDLRDEETGGGVSTYLTDNEYPLIIVDHTQQKVYLETVGRSHVKRGPDRDVQFTFQEFVDLPKTLQREVSWADLGYDRG